MKSRAALIAALALVCGAIALYVGHRVSPRPAYNEYGQLVFYPNKREVARPAITQRTLVAFTFGQSNAANHGSEKFRAVDANVVNFWNGRYFAAEDPLLGATGDGGSVWIRMASKLIAAKAFDSAILLAAGIAGASVRDWTTGGRLNAMLELRLGTARDAGLTVTHFLWHQGEADSNAPDSASYDAAMLPIVALTRHYFPQSKFFNAQATICGHGATPNLGLQKVQLGLGRLPGVYAGPNTDEIGPDGRYDGCHMNGSGLEKHATGWAAAIAAHVD